MTIATRGSKMLIQYVREGKGQPPFGVVVWVDGNFGYSLCNPVDKWDRQRAIEIAKGRATCSRNCKIMDDLWISVDEGKPKAKMVDAIMQQLSSYMNSYEE